MLHRRAAQVPHRQEHAEREHEHQHAQHHDQDRLDLLAQGLELVLDLAGVEAGDLVHQLVDRAGLLAHRDHLQHHRGEDAGGGRRAQDRVASLDRAAHAVQAPRDVLVLDRLRDHAERLLDRHAAAQRQREAAREARQHGLADDLAGHRHLQQRRVDAQPALGRAAPGPQAEPAADGSQRHRPAPVDGELRGRHQHPGGQRQGRPGGGEDAREGRDHHQVDDAQGHHHRGHHEARVAHGRLDLLAQQVLELEVVEQPQEDLIEPAGHLAHAHQRDIDRVEDAVMPGQRHGQRDARFQALAHLQQHVLDGGVDGRFLQAGQRPQDRHARAQQRVQLAREQQLVGQVVVVRDVEVAEHRAPAVLRLPRRVDRRVQRGVERQARVQTAKAVVFGGTGPVGVATGIIASLAGADTTIVDHLYLDTASDMAKQYNRRFGCNLKAAVASFDKDKIALLKDVDVIFCTAKAGIQVLNATILKEVTQLKVAGDVNAVPPAGIEGVNREDSGTPIIHATHCNAVGVGALAVGNIKYQVQHALLASMLESDKPVYLDFRDAFVKAQEILK